MEYNNDNISALKELQPLERALAYFHRNNIPLTSENLSMHQDQLKAELGMSTLPSDVSEYFAKRSWEYQESDVTTGYLKTSRVNLFIHPRFAPMDVHSHNYFEIKYLLGSSADILIAGTSVSMAAGDLLVIAPGVEHLVTIYDAESTLINIVIAPETAAAAFPRIFLSENPLSLFFTSALQNTNARPFLFCHTSSDRTIQQLISDAYHKRDNSASLPSYILRESILEHLLLEVLSSHSDDFDLDDLSPVYPEKLFPILGYINDHCDSVSLTELSHVFNYSPAHLSRIIKRHTGKSFSSLLRSARLSQASLLLVTSDISIQEIIFRTGYAGKAHFYRVFHDAYGMTPSQFRAQKKPFKQEKFSLT